MYHNNRSHNRFGGQNRFRRNFRPRNRVIKSFDPSNLIRNEIRPQTEEKPYVAVNSFDSLAISDILKRNIRQRGYETPTPIQDQVIPLILQGRDVIGIANTGTGKTAAFLIPLINDVAKNGKKRVLSITPTRELAVQIKNEFRGFARGISIFCTLAIGGVSTYQQKYELRRNPHFVIGTPGRLKDLIQQRSLDLSAFQLIVLDEVDQMVDIGFLPAIKQFISLLAPTRQSLFFSATVDPKAKDIIHGFVRNAVTVSVKKQDMLHNIKHDVVRVNDKEKKIEKLHDLLIKKEFAKVLIFGRTKWGVQKLADELVERGFNADAIHGNHKQSRRLRILDKFKRNELQILLATDVASRGLDIDDVSHVINYDPPESYEVYIHRIGRTGRATKDGVAITFI